MKLTMKYIVFYITVVVLVTTVLNMSIFKSTPQHETTNHGSIVRLVRDGRTFCSGVVVNDHTVITASHCVLQETIIGYTINQEPIELRMADNKPIGVRARAYGARVQLDQALLLGDFTMLTPRKTMTSVHDLNQIARYNTMLIACGYPMGGELFCSKLYYQDFYNFMWDTRGLLLPGMSGGPVMLPDGTVVAINISVSKDTSQVSPIYNIENEYIQGVGKSTNLLQLYS